MPENPARKYVEKEVCIKVEIKKWGKNLGEEEQDSLLKDDLLMLESGWLGDM